MKRPKISQVQIVTFLLSGIVGSGIINLPAELAKATHQDAWVPSLLGGVVVLILTNVGLSLCKQYPHQNILEIGEYLVGSIVGKFLAFLFFVYYYLMLSLSVRISVDFISSWILPSTPIESMIILFGISAIFLTRNGLQSLLRFTEITIVVLIPFLVSLIIPVGHWDILNLQPVVYQPVSAYLEGTLYSSYAYLGFEALFFIIPFIEIEFKPLRRTINLTIISIIIIYTIFTVVSILTFGSNYIQDQIYTAIKYIQLLQFPVIERVEFVFAYFWIFALFSTFAIFHFFSYTSLKFIVPVKNKFWLIPFSIPMYFLALYPDNFPEVNKIAEVLSLASILMIGAIVFSLKIVSLFKK